MVSHADGDGIHVLHLDDDRAFLDLTERWLEAEHDTIDVTSMTDPDEAMALLQGEISPDGGIEATEAAEEPAIEAAATDDTAVDDPPFDCVVSDYDMPGTDGLEFLEQVREDYPDLPFVLFTGKGSEEIASEAISAGVTDYLQKGTGGDRFTVLANRIENAVRQRRAERQAERSARRVRQVFDRITDAFVATDREWRYTFANEQALELLDIDREDLLGTSMFDAFPEVEGTTFEAAFERAMREQEPVTAEDYFEPLDAWIEVRAFPARDGLSIYFRDVSERKERERRFDAIFNNTFQFTGLMEPDGTLVKANDTALAFGGVDPEDVIGKKVWNTYWFRIDEETPERVRRDVECARQGEFVRYELEVQGAEGTAIIDFSLKPVTDEAGEVVLIVPEGRDITELKERERELERKNERLEAFASVVSHDLKNPLGVAKGNLELFREEGGGDLELVVEAEAALDRMERLIEDLLDLAEQGRVVDDPEAVDLGPAIRRTLSVVDAGEVALRFDGTDRTVAADPDRLGQLLENLLTNAVEHAEREVRVTVEDGTIAVEDDGPGVPPDERERIFEPGYTTDEDGHGFGLAIARNIATAHGWTIEVTGSDLGGARFVVDGLDAADRGDERPGPD